MNNIELAEVPLNYARMAVRDLIQQAFEAGQTSNEARVRGEAIAKPSADEVNRAVQAIERNAVLVAHARMEHVATACGFEGLTEALGYLQTLRENPIAELLREAVSITPDSYAWNEWLKRARAVVGDKAPPPETIELPTPPARPQLRLVEPEVLSGCVVRAEIQRGPWLEENDGRPLTLGRLGDGPNLDNLSTQQEMCVAEIAAVVEPKNRHGQTCAQTCGAMAAGGFHSALCHTVEAMMRGAPTSKT